MSERIVGLREGATKALQTCLNVVVGEGVTVAETLPHDCCDSIGKAWPILWWYDSLFGTDPREASRLEKAVEKLMEQRHNVIDAIADACLRIGATLKVVGIDTNEDLNENFEWTSREKARQKRDELMNDTDVLIDLTMFGLDRLPPAEGRHHCLRKEILARNKEIRGADLHSTSESSFVTGGAMCVSDYEELKRKVLGLAKLIKADSVIRIRRGSDTNITIKGVDPNQVYKATGMLSGKESDSDSPRADKREDEQRWHFLPSGAVFLTLGRGQNVGVVHPGRVTFDGPCFGFGSLKKYPLICEIDKDGRIDSEGCISKLSKKAPYFSLVKNMFETYPESREIGELFIGLNPNKGVFDINPMEFQVAGGNVSLALGRNDHMGGPIKPSESCRGLHIHASVPGATVHVNNLCVIREGKIMEDSLKKK